MVWWGNELLGGGLLFSEGFCSSYYLILFVNTFNKGQHGHRALGARGGFSVWALHLLRAARVLGFPSQSKYMHLGKRLLLFVCPSPAISW